MIIGCNGYIWISAASQSQTASEGQPATLNSESSRVSATCEAGELDIQTVPLEVRKNICRFANSVRVLSALGFLIQPDSILDTFDASVSLGVAVKDMLGAEFSVVIAEREAARRSRK